MPTTQTHLPLPAQTGYALENLLRAADEQQLEALDSALLEATPPHVIAGFLERLNLEQQRIVLRQVDEAGAGEVIAEMDEEEGAEVMASMREWRAVKILEGLDPDDAADIVGEMDAADQARLLGKVDSETEESLRELLEYDPESAGGIMTTQVATMHQGETVDSAISIIRTLRKKMEDIFLIYVLDAQERLVGMLKLHDLILADAGTLVENIMQTDIRGICTPDVDKELVAQRMAEFNFHALPVVNEHGVFLGIVSHDDVMDVLQEEATEDMQKLVGAGGDESIHDGVWHSARVRVPWLFVNLLTASCAAAVVSLFEASIAQLTILAVFMPVIAGIGGNTGQQTLAVAIRSLAIGSVAPSEGWRLCLREALKGTAAACCVGTAAAFLAWAISGNPEVGGVVFAAMLLNMTLAGLVGALIPFSLKRLGLDPAQSSSIFLTAVTDVCGFFIFLGLAAWVLLM